MRLTDIFPFLLALGVLVTIHELGHYLVARWCGVKVLRFSVGMGKVIYAKKMGKDQTEWAISLLPLGGYVKMLDKRDEEQTIAPDDVHREFTGQSVWKRIAIVAAGPMANFILAIFVFFGIFLYGVPEPSSKIRVPITDSAAHSVAYSAGLRQDDVVVSVNGESVSSFMQLRILIAQIGLQGDVAHLTVKRLKRYGNTEQLDIDLPLSDIAGKEWNGDFTSKLGFSFAAPPAIFAKIVDGSPAAKAGLKAGDQIMAIDEVEIVDGRQLVEVISRSIGKPLRFFVQRGSQGFELDVVPEKQLERGKEIWRIGTELVANPELVVQELGPIGAFTKGMTNTWDSSLFTLKMMGNIVIGQVSWKNISGPITIADYAGQTSRKGLIVYLNFIALISISLGVMNLLPIPVLDGGHLLYYAVEVLMGKPLPEYVALMAQKVGVVLLMSLMAVAFFNDLVRLMS
jgi:regulator of sigma E protease